MLVNSSPKLHPVTNSPVVDKSDVASGSRCGGAELSYKTQDLCGQCRELTVLNEVAQVKERHFLFYFQ